MSFFEELKRRNVIRVGIAYVIVAWLVLQFADVVLNNIQRRPVGCSRSSCWCWVLAFPSC